MSADLRVLDRSSLGKEFDLVSKLFHQVNRIIPPGQKVFSLAPDCLVRDAIDQMDALGYSQVPVVQDAEVLGVFSLRSFASEAARSTLKDLNEQQCAPGDLRVDEFLEPFEFARVKEGMDRALKLLNRDDGLLVGTPERLIGILTPMDFVNYLYDVASPFVMLSEIELAVRELIRLVMDADEIAEASRLSLKSAYGDESRVPTVLEEMTFDNYKSLVSHGKNWDKFQPVFGGARNRIGGKLKEIGEIRNALFHFKREITIRDHQDLAGHRDWLLSKVKQARKNTTTTRDQP